MGQCCQMILCGLVATVSFHWMTWSCEPPSSRRLRRRLAQQLPRALSPFHLLLIRRSLRRPIQLLNATAEPPMSTQAF